MCLSIGAPSVSIWKKATSNRRHGYRLHISRDGRIQRARHELVELLGVRAQSPVSIDPARFNPPPSILRVVFRRLPALMNQQRRHLLSGPRRIDATAVEGFGRIALNIGARLKLLIWLVVQELVERQADVSTSVRFCTVPDLAILTCGQR